MNGELESQLTAYKTKGKVSACYWNINNFAFLIFQKEYVRVIQGIKFKKIQSI